MIWCSLSLLVPSLASFLSFTSLVSFCVSTVPVWSLVPLGMIHWVDTAPNHRSTAFRQLVDKCWHPTDYTPHFWSCLKIIQLYLKGNINIRTFRGIAGTYYLNSSLNRRGSDHLGNRTAFSLNYYKLLLHTIVTPYYHFFNKAIISLINKVQSDRLSYVFPQRARVWQPALSHRYNRRRLTAEVSSTV